ncbi:Nicotinamide riboside kinase [Golovinomyces cichoracearum]|uniref:Nicotinamide riboside kinase n=1 Tax=Golovinomyces cichoracearum TaxID=62708 RepID=A0A420HFE8_9PEZI|nr:Nicotinamide riboside kinase [Golovinomyces cichoracearum]
MDENQRTVIIGISGASSCGKTTLCHLLRLIFPNILTLHEDDFFKPDKEIPMKDGLRNWDCAEALSITDMIKSLEFIRQNGALPPQLISKEDQDSVSELPVSSHTVDTLKAKVNTWLAPDQPGYVIRNKKVFLLDGFLLFSQSVSSIWPYLDLKIFLQCSYKNAKARREERNGYITIDDIWKDPPNYVDNIVWPNYQKDHSWIFESGDVEGKLLNEPEGLGKLMTPGGIDVDLEKTLVWIVEIFMKELPGLFKD